MARRSIRSSFIMKTSSTPNQEFTGSIPKVCKYQNSLLWRTYQFGRAVYQSSWLKMERHDGATFGKRAMPI
jgi:hypothetical protein